MKIAIIAPCFIVIYFTRVIHKGWFGTEMIAAEKTSPLSLSFSLGQNKMEQQTSYPPEINEAEQRTKRVIFPSLIGGREGEGV